MMLGDVLVMPDKTKNQGALDYKEKASPVFRLYLLHDKMSLAENG